MVPTYFNKSIISTHTGSGSLELGLEIANRLLGGPRPRYAAYVEREAFQVYNLLACMEKGILDPAPVWSDVKTFPFGSFHGRISAITGSYPCQPFSTAGKKRGAADPRHTWPHLADGIRAARPIWCFFENVANHINLGFENVVADLLDLGYAVEAGIFSATEVGATHSRRRLFILAIRAEELENIDGIRRVSKQALSDAQAAITKLGTLAATSRLADTYRADFKEPKQRISEKQKLDPIGTDGGDGLADTNSVRIGESSEESESSIAHTDAFRWSSRYGFKQWRWEHPRIEPRMGYAIDGYNFRVDLLRMAGNSVVPQQAALAYLSLLKSMLYAPNATSTGDIRHDKRRI